LVDVLSKMTQLISNFDNALRDQLDTSDLTGGMTSRQERASGCMAPDSVESGEKKVLENYVGYHALRDNSDSLNLATNSGVRSNPVEVVGIGNIGLLEKHKIKE
jgi:hypothetical protein